MTCFNSSMVRLEVDEQGRPLVVHQFQFQYGSIGSISLKGACMAALMVSIPVWFDWKSQYFSNHFSFCNSFNSSMVRLEVYEE